MSSNIKLLINVIILLQIPNHSLTINDANKFRNNHVKFEDHDTVKEENLIQFIEDNNDNRITKLGNVKFEDDTTVSQYGLNAQAINENTNNDQYVNFNPIKDDTNEVTSEGNVQKKRNRRRRRKRKPRQGYFNGSLRPDKPGFNYGYQNPGFYGPVQQPSLTQQATSLMIDALTSISLYDDLQCVPKLLCDVTAGRSDSVGGMFQNLVNLQPLLTLILAYNGITSSPLYTFGRAIFLGMSSSRYKPYTCQQAYPKCPTDPDKLVHYLNNHNGGFFRYFNNPSQNQGLNQFLGHLSHFSDQQNINRPFNQPVLDFIQHNLGQYSPNSLHQNLNSLHPNLYQNLNNLNPNLYQNLNYNQLYNNQNALNRFFDVKNEKINGKYRQSKTDQDFVNDFNSDQDNRDKFQEYFKKQDKDYLEDLKNNVLRLRSTNENELGKATANKNIQRRILTHNKDDGDLKELIEAFNDELKSKWAFPKPVIDKNIRNIRNLVFPNDKTNHKTLNFDQNQSKPFKFSDNDKERVTYNIRGDKMVNFSNNYGSSDDFELIYIVRGNGDPNYPEVVKVKRGNKI